VILSLVSLHDSCKRGIKLQKKIVGLHSPLHTIHYISRTSFKTSQPDYGRRSKRKIPKQHKATGLDRILVETTTNRRKRHKHTATLFMELSEVLEPAPASISAEPASGVVVFVS